MTQRKRGEGSSSTKKEVKTLQCKRKKKHIHRLLVLSERKEKCNNMASLTEFTEKTGGKKSRREKEGTSSPKKSSLTSFPDINAA